MDCVLILPKELFETKPSRWEVTHRETMSTKKYIRKTLKCLRKDDYPRSQAQVTLLQLSRDVIARAAFSRGWGRPMIEDQNHDYGPEWSADEAEAFERDQPRQQIVQRHVIQSE
jgi:hypothetical protein